METVIHNDQATLCGPAGLDPPAYPGVDIGQAGRICREGLEQPDRHAALRYLRDALPTVESRLAGIRNEGFLATHELEVGARRLSRWDGAQEKGRTALTQHNEKLLRALGFCIEPCDQVTSILRTDEGGQKVAVAVLLQQSESLELQADRFAGMSPVSYALTVAERENLPYLIVTQGSKLRLYPVRIGVGVGRRGRTETYVEIHTSLLRDSDAAYLWLLFSAEALVEGGTLDELLEESRRFAGNLAERLRERIYDFVIPPLAQGLASARGLKKPTAKDLAETYEMAVTVLFRLLFIAYAEDKDLLPYRWNGLYRSRSLKQKATELVELRGQDQPFDDTDSLWEEVARLFRAVEEGKPEWGVPEYDGGLFSTDPEVSRVGSLLVKVTLPNTVMGPVLSELLTAPTPDGVWGPVDFRSLGVREFGTIYEGLLESELSVAETDLTVDDKGFYRPCQEGEEPRVRRQHIYLHDRSGARKATGTYFTKRFAVEHLLDHALEPALKDHLARLQKLDDDEAAERFFDFRVADIAMGSGHFLVAAVDRIERGLTQYLSQRSLSGVRYELAKLRKSALDALGPLADTVGDGIEDTQLLHRLIARRCIYGVDINPVAVNLARLSIWIHTLVPGLPLSLLDHNLVVGNSLVGIGRVSEIEDKAKEDDLPLFTLATSKLVGEALEPLRRLARIADATAAEIKRARKAMEEAREAVRPAEALCDITTACRMTGDRVPIDLEHWETTKDVVVDSRDHMSARESLTHLSPLHFPVAFPEVFLRNRSGFDVILGNPPWEEATVEEHSFWARHAPGLRGMLQRDQEVKKAQLRDKRTDLVSLYEEQLTTTEAMRLALTTGPYPGMGTGDPDVYKAFCWRFWRLTPRDGGRIGVVLPRSALSAKGSMEFRVAVFKSAEIDITMVVNYREWVFDGVHQQYAIGLVAVDRDTASKPTIRLRGPFYNMNRFVEGIRAPATEFSGDDLMGWADSASLPLLPAEDSLAVFTQLRKAPRLDLNDTSSWRVRPHRELDATNDKKHMDVESEQQPSGYWPVYKGESFEIWNPETGRYYAWTDPEMMLAVLQKKRERGGRNRRSAFSEFDPTWLRTPDTLPCHSARIAFRDGTNRLNERTIIAALLPPKVFVGNQAPVLVWPRGTCHDEAYLLGVLCAVPLDWYARRFVERHLNFFLFNPLPISRPPEDSSLRMRVIQLAGRLAAFDDRFEEWAETVGVECGPLEASQKNDMIHELDAVVAHLYGLSEKQLVHIFETFHEGWDYADRLKATLKHFRAWKGKT